jgi:hypothetical protein
MADEVNALKFESVQRFHDIVDHRGEVVSVLRLVRCAEPPAGETENVKALGKAGGKFVEHMCGVTMTCEEDDRFPRTAPVEHLHSYARFHFYETYSMP